MDWLIPPNKVSDLQYGFGGVLMLLLLQGKMPIRTAAVMVAGGLICVYVFPDMMMYGMKLPEIYRPGVVFGCGLLGMQTCGVIVSIWKRLDFVAILRKIPFLSVFLPEKPNG